MSALAERQPRSSIETAARRSSRTIRSRAARVRMVTSRRNTQATSGIVSTREALTRKAWTGAARHSQ